MERTCRRCHSTGPFHQSYLANHNYLCKQCACSSVKECRLRDPSRLRASNSQRKKVSQEIVSQILSRWKNKSVLSGESDVNQLCIIPYFRDVPMSEWNGIVVTRREARRLAHLKATKRHDAFSQEVQQEMNRLRGGINSTVNV